MSDDRPVRYQEDGKTYYRASGLMFCDKVFIALVENYTPMSHPAWFQEVLDEGSRMEQQITDMYITEHDMFVEQSQRRIELEVLEDVYIVGHIDGQLAGTGTLFEAKKFRESTWTKFLRQGVECMPWYPWQVSAYMHGLGVDECEFTGGLYDKAKDKITEIYTHHLMSPPIPLIALQKRVAKLEALINKGDRVEDVPCTVRMFPCPFNYLHPEDDAYQPSVKPSDEIIEGALAEYNELSAQLAVINKEKKALDDRKSAVKAGIHAWLELAGTDDDEEVEVAGHTLKFHTSPVKGYTVEPGERLNISVAAVKVTSKLAKRAKK